MSKRRGSTLVEFAFVIPVGVVMLVAGLSMATACLRTIEAGQLARDVSLLADSGVDLGSPGGQQRLIERGRELGVASGHAAVYVTRIVREPAGLRVDQTHKMGAVSKWSLPTPPQLDDLKPGDAVWVVDVIAESGSFTPLLPETIKARNVL